MLDFSKGPLLLIRFMARSNNSLTYARLDV
jgi:hypothetical protein